LKKIVKFGKIWENREILENFEKNLGNLRFLRKFGEIWEILENFEKF
jgi:hypothetical protein